MGFFDIFKGDEVDACGQWGDGIGPRCAVGGDGELRHD